MSIEWKGTLLFSEGRCVASIYHTDKGWWSIHHSWVHKHLKPKHTPCKTIAGIKRKVERYARVWLVAGKPDGDDL
jgi:hypothetical protein